MEAVLAEQARLLDRYERAGGPAFEGRVRAMLAEIGLEERELELPTRVLSGGQRKLIGLAAAIIQDPQLLLLDEPEAHLDLEGRERLQGLMTRFGGGILAVSHDRYLLDETVTDIASLDAGAGPHLAGQLHRLRGRARAGAEAPAGDLPGPAQGDRAAGGGLATPDPVGAVRARQPVEQGPDERRPQPAAAGGADGQGGAARAGAAADRAGAASAPARRQARRRAARGGHGLRRAPRAARRGRDGHARRAGRRGRRERRGQERDAQDAGRRAGTDRRRGVGRPLDPDRLPGAGPGHPGPGLDAARHPARQLPRHRGAGRGAADDLPVRLRAGAAPDPARCPAASERGCS